MTDLRAAIAVTLVPYSESSAPPTHGDVLDHGRAGKWIVTSIAAAEPADARDWETINGVLDQGADLGWERDSAEVERDAFKARAERAEIALAAAKEREEGLRRALREIVAEAMHFAVLDGQVARARAALAAKGAPDA